MKRPGYVDSEGGPLLLADLNVVQSWHGSDGTDYEQMCSYFTDELEGLSIPVGSGHGIFWDTQGAGTSDIFVDENSNGLIIRAWLDDPDDSAIIENLARIPISNPTLIGILEVQSGVLVILWSPENGEFVRRDGTLNHQLSSEHSCLILDVPLGTYRCLHDEVENDTGTARRCHFIRQVL